MGAKSETSIESYVPSTLTYIPSHLYAIYDPITKDVYTMNHRRFIYECVVQFLEEALQGFGKVLGKLATKVESIF